MTRQEAPLNRVSGWLSDPKRWVCCAVLILGCASLCNQGLAASLTLDAVSAKIDALHSFTATYDVQTDHDIDPASLAGFPEVVRRSAELEGLRRTDKAHEVFAYLDGRVRIERIPSPDVVAAAKAKGIRIPDLEITTLTPDRFEQMGHLAGARVNSGGILNPDQPKERFEEWTIDIALGLRLYRDTQPLTPSRLAKAAVVSPPDADVAVIRLSTANGIEHELRFEKKLAYALSYYRATFQSGGFEEISNSDFAQFNGVFLPRTIVRSNSYLDANKTVHHSIVRRLTVREYVVDDPKNVDSRFRVIWPAHSLVLDQRTGKTFNTGPKDRALSDADISELLKNADSEHAEEQGATPRSAEEAN